MRIVIALGGNALLRRSDPMTTEVQRRNVKIAAEAILEEHVIGADGLHMGPNLLDYKIPTSLDVPELIRVIPEICQPRVSGFMWLEKRSKGN